MDPWQNMSMIPPICFRTSWRWIPHLRNVYVYIIKNNIHILNRSPPPSPQKTTNLHKRNSKKNSPNATYHVRSKKQGNQTKQLQPTHGAKNPQKNTKKTNPNTRGTSWSRFKKSNKEGGKASIKRPKSSSSESHRHEESDPGSPGPRTTTGYPGQEVRING